MRSIDIISALTLLASTLPVLAGDGTPSAAVVVKPLLSTGVTSTGDPIVLPQKDVQLLVSTYDIPPGAALPVHKHPYPRYGYVLAGTIQVTNTETGHSDVFHTGDFILEAVDHSHKGSNVGDGPVKLLVIDLVERGHANVTAQ